MKTISAATLGAVLATALLVSGCEDKKPEPTKVPEKSETKANTEPEAKAKTEEKKDDTVAAKEQKTEGDEKAGTAGSAEKDPKKKGKEGSCGEGSCG